ncbi:MAG: tetratricopeptide repeat protein [Candidatus Latescibacteria bacterium]|nr:tetratricopeptide repeat protein [Candidatus Latescibacterota bacterium]
MKKYVYIIIVICLLLLMLSCGCSKSADVLYNNGKTLILNKETFTDGLKTLRQFEDKFPQDKRTPEVVLALAMALQGDKQYDEAVKTYERLIEKYPASPEAYKGMFMLGYMYYDEIKDNEKTLTVLKEFITTYPDSELTLSAEVLIKNIGLPVEEWSVVKEIGLLPQSSDSSDTDR